MQYDRWGAVDKSKFPFGVGAGNINMLFIDFFLNTNRPILDFVFTSESYLSFQYQNTSKKNCKKVISNVNIYEKNRGMIILCGDIYNGEHFQIQE